MDQIVNQREIIDRRSVSATLSAIAQDEGLTLEARRARCLEVLKTVLAAGRTEIRTRFEEGRASGAETVRAGCFLIDQLVRLIHDYADRYVYRIANPTQAERLSIVAVGG